VSNLYSPLQSLQEGNWFKLICGASFQALPDIRSLVLAYTLAGADCIDVAADPAVIAAAKEAIAVSKTLSDRAIAKGFGYRGIPWLMVSLNDGEDPHFRKAQLDSTLCPVDCSRPCLTVCPAGAIYFAEKRVESTFSGVIDQRCYGCGRCLPVCPSQLIDTRSYVSTPTAIAPLIRSMDIDAIEIHTSVGREADFQRLWQAIAPESDRLKLLAISCPDAPDYVDYLDCLYQIISPLPCALIWQTDGRPMSGDIGAGTTHAAIKLAQKALAANLPGYVQLAGGTNDYTVHKLQAFGLLKRVDLQIRKNQQQTTNIAGIAYGSYARSLLLPILEKLETSTQKKLHEKLLNRSGNEPIHEGLENDADLLWEAVAIANSLVKQIKLSTSSISHINEPIKLN
jgi:Fe-S-cluster-containing hydrogenase component 2